MATAAVFPRQRGALLVLAALFMLVVLAFMGTVFLTTLTTSTSTASNEVRSTRALYVAESGLERAVRLLTSPVIDATGADPDRRRACSEVAVALGNVPFPPGRFTVVQDAPSPYYPAAPATLTAAINATDNVIPVSADPLASGYPPAGRIMIDRELLDYSGTTAASFTNVLRGRDATTATSHAGGARIGHYQCSIASSGGVPDLAAPAAQRTLDAGIQLQEGWAVGGVGLSTEDLNGLHCLSDTDCWAVGNNGTIAHWNGIGWGLVPAPVAQDLNDVFCAGANDCWAVGQSGVGAAERPLILWWDGATWATRNSNLNINVDLDGVSCTSTDNCWAVGQSGAGAAQRPLILWWDGATWATRNSNLNINEDLHDVTCAGANDCWAVGQAGAGAAQRPFILWWNGATWATRNSNLNINVDLNGVYCAGANDCWAVGPAGAGAAQRPFILWWNGATWATRNSNLNIDVDLNGVHCSGANDCWAVGPAGAGAAQRPFILWWNGATWATRNSNLNINEDLRDIHMTSANEGWAVGTNGTILRWDAGAWSLWQQADAVALRFRGNAWSDASGMLPVGTALLNSFSPLSYADGCAGGAPSGANATVARWNGSGWALSPPAPAVNRDLQSVSLVSSTDGWAVGNRIGGGTSSWTFLRWNNPAPGAWSGFAVDTAPVGAQNLNSVVMLSATDGWAVGNRSAAAVNGWTFLRWNNPVANTWNLSAVDTTPDIAQNLNAVHLPLSLDGWAVGNRSAAAVNGWTFLRWNNPVANTWNRYAVNTAPTVAQNLNSVFMLSATDGWAVGNRSAAAVNGWTFLRWNNPVANTWNRYAVNTAPTVAQNLNSVFMVSSADGWAVGNSGSMLHWDGTTWSVVAPLTARNLMEVAVIGPRQRPQAVWREQVR